MNNRLENTIGLIGVVLVLALGGLLLGSASLALRLVFGVGLGYALTRGYMGFAGSVNRSYQTGSTRLMRALMLMFCVTAALSIAVLYGKDAASYDLWVNPINFGLILGGVLFGFGMTFSSCCASGVLTDIVTGLPRAAITLLFFGMGVFLGFPIQSTASWVTDSWFTSPVGEQLYGGVYLPDLFAWDGFGGYLGAMLLTLALAAVVVALSKLYEKKRSNAGTLTAVPSEQLQEDAKGNDDLSNYSPLSARTYERFFVKPWSLTTGAIVISGIFTLMMGITKMGWGASTPYGFWFGKFLMIFGVSPEALASFSTKPEAVYTMPFFQHPINVQNIGIILGTILALLLAGDFVKTVKAGLKIRPLEAVLFAMGGILMGLGTRFANGCNVGSLYTPIANFSLSGWVFLAFLVLGGVLGNMVAKRFTKTCC